MAWIVEIYLLTVWRPQVQNPGPEVSVSGESSRLVSRGPLLATPSHDLFLVCAHQGKKERKRQDTERDTEKERDRHRDRDGDRHTDRDAQTESSLVSLLTRTVILPDHVPPL